MWEYSRKMSGEFPALRWADGWRSNTRWKWNWKKGATRTKMQTLKDNNSFVMMKSHHWCWCAVNKNICSTIFTIETISCCVLHMWKQSLENAWTQFCGHFPQFMSEIGWSISISWIQNSFSFMVQSLGQRAHFGKRMVVTHLIALSGCGVMSFSLNFVPLPCQQQPQNNVPEKPLKQCLFISVEELCFSFLLSHRGQRSGRKSVSVSLTWKTRSGWHCFSQTGVFGFFQNKNTFSGFRMWTVLKKD